MQESQTTIPCSSVLIRGLNLQVRQPRRALRFERSNVWLVLQAQADIVEAVQQAVAAELINSKPRLEAAFIAHRATLQINCQAISAVGCGPARQLANFFFA